MSSSVSLDHTLTFSQMDTHTQTHFAKLTGAAFLVVFVLACLASLKGFNGRVEGRSIYFVVVIWLTMSFFMNLMNKQCTVLLQCPFTLVMIQMIIAIVILAGTPLTNVSKKDLWRWSALALLFGMMLCSSMFSFAHASVTCLLVLRNCLPLFTLPLEKAIFQDAVTVSAGMVASLFAIAMGAALYAFYTPGHGASTEGLVWILINSLITVVHRVLERSLLTSDMKLSFEAMTLLYNVIPLLPIGMLAWATGETQQWSQHMDLLNSPMAIAVIGCSGVVGVCLGQGGIMVQKAVTATTLTVLQTTAKMVIIVGAMVVFNDRFTYVSFCGCGMSLLGSAAYAMSQHYAKQGCAEQKCLIEEKAGARNDQC